MSRKNKNLTTRLPSVSATETPSVSTISVDELSLPVDVKIESSDVLQAKKTVYSVVSIPNQLEMFTSAVNNFLNDGWQLQGGVSTSVISNEYNVSIVYSQAVYKMI